MAHQVFKLPPQQPLSAAGRVLPGSKAYFYVTNTSTPTPVYTTSALSVAHSQPVIADGGGRFAAIYLDPQIEYKLTVTDANDVLLYTVDPVNDQLLSQALIGEYLYPRTAAEQAAGVTPEEYAYQPGDVRRYGAVVDNVTDDADALTDAIAQAAENNGAPVYIPGFIATESSVVLESNITIYGDGDDVSGIRAVTDDFNILTDNNVAVSGVVIEDLRFEAISPGTANFGILLDADTASQSESIYIRRCRFKNLFRGFHAHRATNVEFDDCVAEDLDDALIYVGLSVSAGRSKRIRVRRPRVEGGDIVHALGSANVLLAYVDGGRVESAEFVDSGASSGSTNLYHAVYLRASTRIQVTGTKGTGHRRGALISVFADTGETRCRNIELRGTEADQMGHYAAIRCDAVDGLIIDGVHVHDSQTQGLYLTDITRLAMSNVTGTNNNQQALSGTENALVRMEDVVGATISGVIGIDDETGSGGYGQGMLFHLGGTCSDIHWSDIHMEFPGGGALGYYCIEVASGATLTRFSVNGVTQNGASNVFHETGVATVGSLSQITMVNTSATSLLTHVQLHKFGCRNVTISGVLWPFESDGTYIRQKNAGVPASGTYAQGDIVERTGMAASGVPGWACTTSGTFSAATDNTGDTDGSTAVITGMTDTSDFFVGEYVTVSAGFASTGPFKIVAVTSTTMTVDANSNSAQSNVTVSSPDPVFKAYGALAA